MSGNHDDISSASTAMLSSRARLLWAKSDPANQDQWLPLYQHMLDSGEVARLLWREWLPTSVRGLIIAQAGSESAAESVVVWLAAVHDLGKATPGFQYKVPSLGEKVRESGLALPNPLPTRPKPHALMSQTLLRRWLTETHRWTGATALTYAIVPGGHHGAPPNEGDMESLLKDPFIGEGLGDAAWRGLQDELAAWAAHWSGVGEHLPALSSHGLPPTLQMLITGTVIMADWIASNSEYFPLFPQAHLLDAAQRARNGWTQAELPPAWKATTDLPSGDTLFRDRFDQLPAHATLRPAQQMMLETARSLTSPGLIIMEAPMGSGKTEAALLAAETIASRFGQGGVAFLLPTMATSNAMFSRILSWLRQVPDADGAGTGVSMSLVHGKAALNDAFTQLRWRTSSVGDQTGTQTGDTLVAPSWLIGRKRSLLSSFVVGTVDQLLMAGLKARHVVLRHLGLAGKVVIVDEVHAYDAYMSTYLDRVLSWLGAYGVPVILLSATLPPSRRQAMTEAYTRRGSRGQALLDPPRTSSGALAYPLVTTCDNAGVRYATCSDDSRPLDIWVEECADDDDALAERLNQMMVDGGCVGVIRDTVTRAQATYDVLLRRFGDDVVLLHSRFVACDRLAKDQDLLNHLGSTADHRPHRLIVVGTQVLEQSLDIDFDLLITDLAPIDLLLQRMGRLHRHPKWNGTRPAPLRQARCLLTGTVDWLTEPPLLDRGVTAVYEKALLWRTIATLRHRANTGDVELHLPSDIAPLVKAVYEWGDGAPDLPEPWGQPLGDATADMMIARDAKVVKASTFLLPKLPRRFVTGLLKADFRDADDDNRRGQAAVRDTSDSVEVVLVQRGDDGVVRLLPWVGRSEPRPNLQKMSDPSFTLDDMEESPRNLTLDTWNEPSWRAARLAATCTVALPFAMNQPGVIDAVIDALERQGNFPGWQTSPWLRGLLPLVLDGDLNARLTISTDNSFHLHYDQAVGLQLLKEDPHE
ncbi:MAG: CRISPR-associated helicase Cas3' [Propionibacteriaceae bacterium]|jgi:CRISPR-associated helicase Cas3/CRISPR-associated endonuclease Cas3-HD|nr:CRISPR-associated helicase Cas3' [Propionibacteriaceae bacterium]